MKGLPSSEKQDNSVQASQPGVSRRQWLGKIAVPTPTTIGAGLIANNAIAGDQGSPQKDAKPVGAGVYNVLEYGARGNGKTLNTKAIQAAIDACFAYQGGTVLIPAGDFLCGTIELKSNVTLHLAAAGSLSGSKRREDYTAGKGIPDSNGNIVFLYAANARNISIEGKGTINGNGLSFYTGKGDNTGPGQRGAGGNFDRPNLAVFYQCTDLTLRDTFLTASAYHCVRILQCKQVHIDGIRIYKVKDLISGIFHSMESVPPLWPNLSHTPTFIST